MNKLFFTIAALLFSFFSFAQSIQVDDCDDRFFTKVEIIPSLKQGVTKYEDTLTDLLKSKGIFNNDLKARYRFIVTKNSHIIEINGFSSDTDNIKAIQALIVSLESMWASGIQNGFKVCAYVVLQFEISNGRLKATVLPNT